MKIVFGLFAVRAMERKCSELQKEIDRINEQLAMYSKGIDDLRFSIDLPLTATTAFSIFQLGIFIEQISVLNARKDELTRELSTLKVYDAQHS